MSPATAGLIRTGRPGVARRDRGGFLRAWIGARPRQYRLPGTGPLAVVDGGPQRRHRRRRPASPRAEVVAVLCWLPDAGVSGTAGSADQGRPAQLPGRPARRHHRRRRGGPLPAARHAAHRGRCSCWRAGQTHRRGGRRDRSRRRGWPRRSPSSAVAYTGCCVVVGPVSRLGTSHAPPVAAPVAAFVLFAVVAGAAVVRPLPTRAARRGSPAPGAAPSWPSRSTSPPARCWSPARWSCTRTGSPRSRARSAAVCPGLPILVIDVLCAPNAAIAGSAYLAGPGFAVGSGTTVNAFSASHGVLPALPVLGAIPDGHGANPLVLALMCLVPLLAAVCVARAVRRRGRRRILARSSARPRPARRSPACALAIAAWLGGGSAGAGRLRVVGRVAVEGRLRGRRRGRRAGGAGGRPCSAAWDRLVPPRPESDADVAEARPSWRLRRDPIAFGACPLGW